jgi:2-polyprenyl-6-methoxyphenol hydroxylase-like FAD-dependent oxidoreductase
MTMEGANGEGDVVLTFAPPRSGGDAPPPVRVRGCVVGADGRNSTVRELTFGGEEGAFCSVSSSRRFPYCTTASARCTPILEDVTARRVFLSAQGRSLVLIAVRSYSLCL